MPHYVVDAMQSLCTWRMRCNTAVGTFGWTMTLLHLYSLLCQISVVSTLKGGAHQHCYQYSGLHTDKLQEVVDMQGQLRRDIARTSCVPPKKPSAMNQVCTWFSVQQHLLQSGHELCHGVLAKTLCITCPYAWEASSRH